MKNDERKTDRLEIVLPESMNRGLETISLGLRTSKSELVREAIRVRSRHWRKELKEMHLLGLDSA